MTGDSDEPPRFEFNLRWYRRAKFLGFIGFLVFCVTPPLTHYGIPFDLLVGTGFLLMLAASIAIGIGLSQNWPRV